MKDVSQITNILDTPTFRLTYGGWYQRTTLHLSEIFEFLSSAKSLLSLDKNKLKDLHKVLEISSVSRELGNLEYVWAITKSGINIRYYEDGLYTLSLDSSEVLNAKIVLENYYEKALSPAINYIFSLGAPTPKILANIKTSHPCVVSIATNEKLETNSNWLKDIYTTIEQDNIQVTKSKNFILVRGPKDKESSLLDIVEMQIFFREFKDQLEKYLNIHRKIWEEIADLKEKSGFKTKDLGSVRNKLDSYQKTISLISNRINQMGSYARTRKEVAQQIGIDKNLVLLFQYRFEVLLDTLDYIKEIWKMTTDYVTSSIQVVVEAQAGANAKNIQSLTLITSIGVIAGLIGHLSRDSYPKITTFGLTYLAGLLFIGWLLNFVVQYLTLNKTQKLRFKETNENI